MENLKASGFDEITTKVIKVADELIVNTLEKILCITRPQLHHNSQIDVTLLILTNNIN